MNMYCVQSLISLELALSPVCLFAIGIENPLNIAGQGSHDPDPRQHRVTAAAAQHQRPDRRLPFRQVGFLLWQLRNVVGCVLQRVQLSAVGQHDGIVKRGRPGQ
jgi:hypothetical protein